MRRLITTPTLIIMILYCLISAAYVFVGKVYAEEPKISKDAVDILSRAGQAMAEVAAAVRPAVVNISTTKTIKTPGIPHPFFDDPFFKRFFGDDFNNLRKKREYRTANLGSGVIVDKNGYILTNNHVIRGAEEIIIKLSDRREFKGKVVGTDPKTDLAVIKITADRLPAAKWGDSDRLRVGETVIAIGNPFGLNQTVTSGIVSATGRANVGIADYEDFIQTDAAINPGNSGGALVNIRGEIIGINTAIFSTSGGYQGIGFAIPSNMARSVMENLIKKGKVVRGWLGLTVQALTPELARQFNLKGEKGVLVADVADQSPASRAGIKRGDVIIEFDGREINDPAVLRNLAASSQPGKEALVKFISDNSLKTAKVVIAELPADGQKTTELSWNQLKGVHVQNITSETRKMLQLPANIKGVLITLIEAGIPAEDLLKKNDVITEINKKKINNVNQYKETLAGLKTGRQILLLIYRNGAPIYITLPPKR